MITRDYHVHSTFSDGKNTPEEVVLSALSKGVTELGFSDHAACLEDPAGSMKPENYPLYRAEIARLKEKYRDRISILCGVEQDLYATMPSDGFDYVIGSAHYVRLPGGDGYIVDNTAGDLLDAAEKLFGGDIYALCESYYETEALIADIPCDIIGHFDLITKFNEGGRMFDETHPRYVAAREKALRTLLKTGRPFEINTGAISRGYRTAPYPAEPVLREILAAGGKLLLGSDSHRADTLLYQFEQWEHLLK